MNLPTEHPHEDLAVLALDALADDERAAVEAHVQRCPACAAELDDYRATLSLVAAEPVTPPSGTWDAIVERVAAGSNGHSRAPIPGPTADTVAGLAPSPPQGPAGPDPTSDTAPASVGAPGGSVTRLDSDPSGPTGPSRFARLRPAAFLAAAAAVVVVVGLAVGLRSDDDDRAGGDVLASAQATIDSPGASVADLATPEGRVVGQVVVAGDEGYALTGGLDILPDGREYQLWALAGGEATSLGMLGDGSSEAVVVTPMGPGVAARLAISEEPAGGVDSPTGPIVATGNYA